MYFCVDRRTGSALGIGARARRSDRGRHQHPTHTLQTERPMGYESMKSAREGGGEAPVSRGVRGAEPPAKRRKRYLDLVLLGTTVAHTP